MITQLPKEVAADGELYYEMLEDLENRSAKRTRSPVRPQCASKSERLSRLVSFAPCLQTRLHLPRTRLRAFSSRRRCRAEHNATEIEKQLFDYPEDEELQLKKS